VGLLIEETRRKMPYENGKGGLLEHLEKKKQW